MEPNRNKINHLRFNKINSLVSSTKDFVVDNKILKLTQQKFC